MNINDRLRAARQFDPLRFAPFRCDGRLLGQVRRDFLPRLSRMKEVFEVSDAGVTLSADLADAGTRTTAIGRTMRVMAEEGVIPGWRDETYAIAPAFGAAPLFHIERAAVRMFGLTSYAVHVNGLTGTAARRGMWIARRSPHKPIDPGMLDNMVGGGLASGLSIAQTLVKEGREEAGAPEAVMLGVRAGRPLRVLREVPEGLQSEVLFTHDLQLPDEFRPLNEDGEVAAFTHLGIGEVLELVRASDQVTLDASLVMLECLSRHGVLGPGQPEHAAVAAFVADS